MNITDLIVELLEKGQKVEMPGIGTLDSVVRSAHHDPNTRTYYPTSRVIAYSTETSGDSEIVKTLAERECVSEDVAKQMWLNYIDALTDKVKRSGHHNFGKLGTLTCDDKRTFNFKMTEGLVLDAGNKGEMPIEEVKIYNHDNEEDPFARFDEAEAEAAPAETAPETPAEPAAEEMTAPKPVAEEEHWGESLKQLEDLEKDKPATDPKAEARAEKERLKAEKKAEEERIKLEKKAEEQRRFDEEQLAKQRKEAERREAEEKRKAAEELRKAEKKAEEERIKAEKKAEAGRIKAEKEAEKERIKAEKKAAALAAITARESAKAEAAARSEAEKEAAKQAAIQAAQEAKERKQAEKEAARIEKERRKEEAAKAKAEAKERKQAEKETKNDDKEKKQHKVWPIVLIVLCLLILAGGAYYLLSGNKTSAPAVTAKNTTHINAGATNAFTYNTDMIDYSGREIEQQSDLVCRFMSEFIGQYLADRNFSGARAPMMDRIRQYANERLGEMMGERFAVQRLIPYDDYIYNYNEPFMKTSYARSCRGKVQSELMNYRALDDMLYRLADELGLQPDGTGRKTAAEVQQVKADEKKAIERRKAAQTGEAPMYVYVEKGSKQGYDLIAGFYLNKNTAAKLTAKLHDLGCDAYIIEFSDMYYVSMGSASSQTAAEALYKHVKSWYDGDVVIKKW